jgi:hypothetical protein
LLAAVVVRAAGQTRDRCSWAERFRIILGRTRRIERARRHNLDYDKARQPPVSSRWYGSSLRRGPSVAAQRAADQASASVLADDLNAGTLPSLTRSDVFRPLT